MLDVPIRGGTAMDDSQMKTERPRGKVIDSIVFSFDALPRNTGLVVGVVERDQCSVFGYGKASDPSAEPPRGDTLFEIGSITKVFTTTLLSVLVADGLVTLNDPVCELVPQLSNLPPEITLLRLATHTSGLPKMPSNTLRSLWQNRRNPFAAYTVAELLEYLSKHRPKQNQQAIAQINYSNLGMALLGYGLSQKQNSTYEQAVVSRICDPLDLPDTRITLTPEQKERLATPHSANGKLAHNWDLPAFAGAGAMRSTANDMLKFLAANLGTRPSSLANVMQTCHDTQPGMYPAPGFLQKTASALLRQKEETSRYRQSIALGWEVGCLSHGGRKVCWRQGATGGYRAFAGFVKDSGAGVVVLANRGLGMMDVLLNTTSANQIGFRILEYLDSSR